MEQTTSNSYILRKYSILLCCCFLSFTLQAQLKDISGLVKQERYLEAVAAFEQSDTSKLNPSIRYDIGIAYLNGQSYPKALYYLQSAIDTDPKVGGKERSYFLGKAYHFNKKYEQAKQLFESYKASVNKTKAYYAKIDHWIKAADYASRLPISNQVSEYQVNPTKGVSSSYRDHSPVVSEDGNTLYFTRREGGKDAKRAPDGKFMEKIMVAKRQKEYQWGEATVVEGAVNSKKHNATITLFDGDQKMLIYQSKHQGDFYVAEREGDSWGKPKPLDKQINGRAYEAHACVNRNNDMMIFSSNRDEGNLDLYVSHRRNGNNWSAPKKLGEHINTLADEDAPFLSLDGKTLYFSSRGHNSIGGYDLFKSLWNEGTQSWGKPKSLGLPFNSPQDDIYIIWDAKEDKGFFASARVGGQGDLDIYEIGRVYNLEVMGKVRNIDTNEPIPNITIEFEDPRNNRSYKVITDAEGSYQITLPSGQEFPVMLYFEKSEIKNHDILLSERIKIPQVFSNDQTQETNFSLNIAPPPTPKRAIYIEGLAKNYQEEKPVSGLLKVRSLTSQKVLSTIDVDVEGVFNDSIFMEADEVVTLDFEDRNGEVFRSVYTVDSTGGTNIEILVDYTLKPTFNKIEATALFDQGKSYRVATLIFDYADANLNDGMKEAIDKVISLQRQYNDVGFRITGHNWGFSHREQDFSQRRVLNIVQYLEEKGIDRDLIKYGYVDQNLAVRKRSPIKKAHRPMANMYERRVDIKLSPIAERD